MNASTKAHGGLGHWWQQRLSSILLIPASLWLLWAGSTLAGADFETARAFFSSPVQAGMGIFLIGLVAFHAQIGIQVICEDYIYPPWFQSLLIWLTRIACAGGFLLIAYALITLAKGN